MCPEIYSGISPILKDEFQDIVCFPVVTTHFDRIFHSPVTGFFLLVFEVS
jgi:hypothetical protein